MDPKKLADEWPANSRQRRDLLREIRHFQNVRKRITELGPGVSYLAPTLWLPVSMRAMLVAGILLLLVNFATLTASWLEQKSANRDFVKVLNLIEYPGESAQAPTSSSPLELDRINRENTCKNFKKALNDFEIGSPPNLRSRKGSIRLCLIPENTGFPATATTQLRAAARRSTSSTRPAGILLQ